MNDCKKSKIQQKSSVFKQCVKDGKAADDYQNLQFAVTELSEYVMERKNEDTIKTKFKQTFSKCKDIMDHFETFYNIKKIP